jgi:hypothetical protein
MTTVSGGRKPPVLRIDFVSLRIGGPGRDRTGDLFHAMNYKNCNLLTVKALIVGRIGKNR